MADTLKLTATYGVSVRGEDKDTTVVKTHKVTSPAGLQRVRKSYLTRLGGSVFADYIVYRDKLGQLAYVRFERV